MANKQRPDRLLHLKLRVVVLEPMTEAEAVRKLKDAARTGIVPEGIDIAWIDWARPKNMMRPPAIAANAPRSKWAEDGARYLGEDAHLALVSFLGAIKHSKSKVDITAAPQPRPRSRRQRAPLLDARRPSRSSSQTYHATLRRALRVFHLTYNEARALYREIRELVGRPVFPADIEAYADYLEAHPDEVEDSILYELEPALRELDEGDELELTARTYRGNHPYWRLEVVADG